MARALSRTHLSHCLLLVGALACALLLSGRSALWAAGDESGYGAHIASYRDPIQAEQGWSILSKRHEAVFKGLSHVVTRVDLGRGKGVWWRVLVGPVPTAAQAGELCRRIKAAGLTCEVFPLARTSAAPDAPPNAPAARPEKATPAVPQAAKAPEPQPVAAPAEIPAAPPVAPSPFPAPPAEPRSFGLHLASYHLAEQSKAGWNALKHVHQPLLDQVDHVVDRVDLGPPKGVVFRLIAGPFAEWNEVHALRAALAQKGLLTEIQRFPKAKPEEAQVPAAGDMPQGANQTQANATAAEQAPPPTPPLAQPAPAPAPSPAQAPDSTPPASPAPSSGPAPAPVPALPASPASPASPAAQTADGAQDKRTAAQPIPPWPPVATEWPMTFAFLLDKVPAATNCQGYDAPGRFLFLPLSRLVQAVRFPIDVMPENGRAIGWFIDETRTFKLIPETGEVVLKGVKSAVNLAMIRADRNDIYVAVDLLREWFPLNFQVNRPAKTITIHPREALLLPKPGKTATEEREILKAAPVTIAPKGGANSKKDEYTDKPGLGFVIEPKEPRDRTDGKANK